MTLVRQNEAILNTDKSAFLAAKRRKEHNNYIKSLEERICKLEKTIECLSTTLEEINKK